QRFTINGEVGTGETVPWPIGAEIRKNFGSDFKSITMASFNSDHILSIGDKKISKGGTFFEPQALDMLSVKMLRGGKSALNDPSSIILSQSAAEAFFGNADPVNKLMKIDNQLTVKITGVYQDFPYSSSFADVKFISPWQLLSDVSGMTKQK